MQYVVYLTLYGGDKLPKFYIGSTSEKNIKEGYNGSVSSKKYKEIYRQEQKENKQLFETSIIYYCTDRKHALSVELAYQKMYNVVVSEHFMNMSLAAENGCFGMSAKGEDSPSYGKKQTEEHISKVRATKIERYGDEFYNNTDKIRETKIERYGCIVPIEQLSKRKQTLKERYGSEKYVNIEKRNKTIHKVDEETGLTIAQAAGIKMANTRKNKIDDETGLNSYQLEGMKLSRKLNEMHEETGLTLGQHYGKLRSEALKCTDFGKGSKNANAKRINIYNDKDELIHECHGNFKEICLKEGYSKRLSDTYRNNTKLYEKCLPNNKEYVKFKGWYARIVE